LRLNWRRLEFQPIKQAKKTTRIQSAGPGAMMFGVWLAGMHVRAIGLANS
jgi:hypothetical protein